MDPSEKKTPAQSVTHTRVGNTQSAVSDGLQDACTKSQPLLGTILPGIGRGIAFFSEIAGRGEGRQHTSSPVGDVQRGSASQVEGDETPPGQGDRELEQNTNKGNAVIMNNTLSRLPSIQETNGGILSRLFL